jgi:NAD(P)-dependent dehydrogenase (short-subunit alcohol dehydrogenase family)
MRFADTVAVVTGGAHGIGRATVENLLKDGARVAVFDIDRDAAESTRSALDASGGRVRAFECDVLDPASVDRAVEAAVREFGRIDVLASVAGGDTPTEDPLDEEHWNRIVSLNLHGPARMIRACLPHLKKTRGSIVLVSSVNGLVAFGEPAYSSAKAGLSLLARNLAVTLGPDGFRINVVAPGTVRTRVWDTQQDSLERLLGNYPLGRVGEPSDIAAAIAFLASSEASWITGVTLPVDGGGTAGPLTSLMHPS